MPAACPPGRAFLISRLSPHLLHPKDHRGLCPHHPQTRPQTQPIEHPSPGNPGYMIPCNCSAWPGPGLQPPLAYILLPGMGKPQLDPYPAAYAAAL